MLAVETLIACLPKHGTDKSVPYEKTVIEFTTARKNPCSAINYFTIAQRIFVECALGLLKHSSADGRITSLAASS